MCSCMAFAVLFVFGGEGGPQCVCVCVALPLKLVAPLKFDMVGGGGEINIKYIVRGEDSKIA